MRQCKPTKLLKKTILLLLIVEPDLSRMVYQFPVIKHYV